MFDNGTPAPRIADYAHQRRLRTQWTSTSTAWSAHRPYAPRSLIPTANAVVVPFVAQVVDGEGRVTPNDVMIESPSAMLGDLESMAAALQALPR
jgi:hypothetical protein